MTRTTTGCLTCRIRRVKCDETKPSCERCTTTGRRCDGYLNRTLSRKSSLDHSCARNKASRDRSIVNIQPRPYSLRFVSDDQLRDFSFFHENTLAHFNEWIDTKLWSQLIPQLSRTDSLIRHGVLALGAIHRNYDSNSPADKETAIREYTKAVSDMRRAIAAQKARGSETELQKILAAVIIFHCLENFVGNYALARVHLSSGLHLLREHSPELPTFHQPVPLTQSQNREQGDSMYDLVFALRRLDVQADTFEDAATPSSYNPEVLEAHEAWIVHHSFASLQQAQNVIIDLLKLAFHINREGFKKVQRIKSEGDRTTSVGLGYVDMQRARCQAQLRQWTAPLEKYKRQMSAEARVKANATLALMEVYHAVATIVITVGGLCLQHGEIVTDAFYIDFESIVTKIESVFPSFVAGGDPSATRAQISCDLGIVGPLFLMAIKCRDPRLRRKAVALLKQCRRREGVWDSEGAAKVAQRVIELEEEGLSNINVAADVPDFNRISRIQTETSIADRKANACFYFRPNGHRLKWEIRSESITF